MKHIMIVDDSQDYAYDIHAVDDADFARIFPGVGQDVEFQDDLSVRLDLESLNPVFGRMWRRRVRTASFHGLHGMLFYDNWDRKPFYPGKRDIAPARTKSRRLVASAKTVLVIDKDPSKPITTSLASPDIFDLIFPGEQQDVEFIDDLSRRVTKKDISRLFDDLTDNVVAKSDINGIQGTLYIGYPEKSMYFVNKIDSELPRHYPLSE